MRAKSSAETVRRGPWAARLGLGGLLLASLALAGCDRCGDPIKFNTPSLPKSCYGVGQNK
ncbi:hypothetical protein [Methylocella silvestris]|nr:hypothetical protein [Methylocella silvestris]